MRKIIGLLAILLGVVGVVLLVAGGIAAWRVEGVVVERTDRATVRTSERLSKVESKLHRLEGMLKVLTVDVEAIRSAGARLVGRVVKDALAQPEINQLLERLSRLLEQSEQLGETLDIVARLFEDSADLSAQVDGNPERTERLKNIAETLEQAGATMSGIRAELGELRLREAATDPQKLIDLCTRSRAPLERMAGGIASIRQYSADTRESMESLRREVRFWMRTAAVLMSLVLVWFGLGQVCLIGWGWRQWQPSPSPVAPEETAPAES